VTPEWIVAGRYEIEVADERMPARVSLRPFYDPASERVKQ
jgi:4-methylaminobutanoate oxidase (formaldehyde-forming)